MTGLRRSAPRRGGGPLAGEGRWALLFLAPTLLGLAVLSAGPILATLAISLTKWDLLTAPKLVGFDNYAALVSDDRFLKALRNTFFYTIVSVPLGLAIALGLALALNQRIRGIAWIRTAYFLPVVTSTIAIALVWQWIYSADQGLLNEVLGLVGIPAQKWLSNPTLAMPAIVAMSIWQGLGTNVIIFLAGLQAIPGELLDAASVDGAGRWARFRNVVLPLLTPSIFFTGVLALIGSFQVFDQIFVLVKPRPTDATITVVYFIYENGFKFFKMGYASAASWVLFLIVAVFTAVYFRSQGRWVHYQ
jgi:multiple sugar transport system permease protein